MKRELNQLDLKILMKKRTHYLELLTQFERKEDNGWNLLNLSSSSLDPRDLFKYCQQNTAIGTDFLHSDYLRGKPARIG